VSAKLSKPFVESISNVLSMMAMLESKPDKPLLRNTNVAKGDVTGIIGMTGDKLNGSFAISFSKSAILQIAKNMVGDEKDSIDDEIKDMVGEITNMTAGGAKKLFEEVGYDFGMATPAVIAGENHKIIHSVKGKAVIVPFITDAGEFFIEFCFQKTKVANKNKSK
jgi:chemotaxis protein CheX